MQPNEDFAGMPLLSTSQLGWTAIFSERMVLRLSPARAPTALQTQDATAAGEQRASTRCYSRTRFAAQRWDSACRICTGKQIECPNLCTCIQGGQKPLHSSLPKNTSVCSRRAHFLRRAVHCPSARPSTLIRPFAESPSIHPARVAVMGAGFALGHVPLNVSST